MVLDQREIRNLNKIYRINLINSITGIKPANLIGTTSKKKQDNLAIFSSVVHLGSNPAQLGIISRPQDNNPKDTYTNIIETGFYSINHISDSFIEQAHYTSAKLDRGVSEFDRMKLNRDFIGDFVAPFVAESSVKIGMRYLQDIALPNGCVLIIGEIVLIDVSDGLLSESGRVELDAYGVVGIGGLDTYYKAAKITTFPYARLDEIPDFSDR